MTPTQKAQDSGPRAQPHHVAASVFAASIFLVFSSLFIEFITGNTPLRAALSPGLVIFAFHYGFGAILIREAIARWNKGLASTLLLGAAYGMVNEAIDSKGFFDPRFYSVVDMGLVGFGRWGGINVIWALGLTVVHMVLSIAVPITLTDAAFPGTRGRLGTGTLGAIFSMFLAVVLFAMNHINPYVPGWKEWSFIVALILLLVASARFLPPLSFPRTVAAPRDRRLFVIGFLSTGIFFFTFTAFHNFVPNPVLNGLALVCLLAAYARLLLKLPDLPPHSRVALAAGIYSVPTLAALLGGLLLQAAIATAVMVAVWRRARAQAVALETWTRASLTTLLVGLLTMAQAGCCSGQPVVTASASDQTGVDGNPLSLPPGVTPVNTEFGSPQRVLIQGYTGSAEEPFLTPDGQYLIFDDRTPTGQTSNIYYAKRDSDTRFIFMGEVAGTHGSGLNFNARMDDANRFYFASTRSWEQARQSIYCGVFNNGTVTDLAPLQGLSDNQSGFIDTDPNPSYDGNLLCFTDNNLAELGDPGMAATSALVTKLAIRNADGSFTKLDDSDPRMIAFKTMFRNVAYGASFNKPWIYPVKISRDGLEGFFNALDPRIVTDRIYIVKRNSTSEPFGVPQLVEAADGFDEGAFITRDGMHLYYHRGDPTQSNPLTFEIYMLTRRQ